MGERYIYRTKNLKPSDYELALARTVYRALEQNLHGLGQIVAELNKSGVRPPDAAEWTEQNFTAEMERLGQWPASTGGPLR